MPKRWSELPKCRVGAWGCSDYYRGRCKQEELRDSEELCNYREEVDADADH